MLTVTEVFDGNQFKWVKGRTMGDGVPVGTAFASDLRLHPANWPAAFMVRGRTCNLRFEKLRENRSNGEITDVLYLSTNKPAVAIRIFND